MSARRLRVVAVTACPPHPPRSGYQIRCWQLLRRLAARHDVSLLALQRDDAPGGAEWERAFVRVRRLPGGRTTPLSLARSLVSATPHHVAIHATAPLRSALAEEAEGADAVVCHYLYFAPCLPPRPSSGGPAFVLDQHNLDREVWDTWAASAPWPWQRAWLARQARLVRAFEERRLRDFDAVIAVSERDARATRDILRDAATRVVVAENGVDLARFGPAPSDAARAPTVAFPGTDARRNVEGIAWFLRACWPAVRARVPDARLVIAGRFAPRALPDDLRAAPGLVFTGEVDDMGSVLREADVAIVPVRRGGGTKIKALEAMAAGLPVVLAHESAAGLDVTTGENALVSADPAAYVADVATLLLQPSRRRAIGLAARRFVEERHGWDSIALVAEEALARAVEERCR